MTKDEAKAVMTLQMGYILRQTKKIKGQHFYGNPFYEYCEEFGIDAEKFIEELEDEYLR